MANEQHIYSGLGAPITIPPVIGAHYIDTQNKQVYFSVGIVNVADWLLGGGGGGGVSAITPYENVSNFEVDAAIDTVPVFLLDTSKPVIRLLVTNPTGVSVTFKIPTVEYPTDGNNLSGSFEWTITVVNYSGGNFTLNDWVDSNDGLVTVFNRAEIADSLDNQLIFMLTAFNSGEYALVKQPLVI